MENQYNLAPSLFNAITFTHFRPVQEAVITPFINGQDIICKAPTGSGKSHAFLIPLIHLATQNNFKGLILAPTKEIAIQLKNMAQPLIKEKTIGIIIGGLDDKIGDIIIATPGRLINALERGLSLKKYSKIVIDEVEMIADLSFAASLDYILKLVAPKRQICAFGAVITPAHKRYLKAKMKNPLVIDSNDQFFFKKVTNYLIACRPEEKIAKLSQLLSIITPSIALIFSANNQQVELIYQALRNKKVIKVNSLLDSRARVKILNECASGKYQYIVASDLFSRGIDIPGVSDVICFDIPSEITYYYHRLGRTGRISEGNSYTFYEEKQLPLIKQLDKKLRYHSIKIKQDQLVPSTKIFRAQKSNKLLNQKIKKEISRIKKSGPCYKQKAKAAAKKIKKAHRRQVVKENIKKSYE